MEPRGEPGPGTRAEVEAERRHLAAVGVAAPDEEARRFGQLAAAPAVEALIATSGTSKWRPSTTSGARSPPATATRMRSDTRRHRRDHRQALAGPGGLRKKRTDLGVDLRAGVDQLRLDQHVARRGAAAVDDDEVEGQRRAAGGVGLGADRDEFEARARGLSPDATIPPRCGAGGGWRGLRQRAAEPELAAAGAGRRSRRGGMASRERRWRRRAGCGRRDRARRRARRGRRRSAPASRAGAAHHRKPAPSATASSAASHGHQAVPGSSAAGGRTRRPASGVGTNEVRARAARRSAAAGRP